MSVKNLNSPITKATPCFLQLQVPVLQQLLVTLRKTVNINRLRLIRLF